MNWMQRLFGRDRLERELDKELSYHIERQVRELVDQGIDPHEAARRVRLSFGGAEQVKEEARDARGTRWVEDFFRDVRHGARVLRSVPVFTSVAILSLALGIGATTAIFSLVDRALLRDMAVQEPGRLVEFVRHWGAYRSNHSHAHFEQFQQELRSFDGLFAVSIPERRDVVIDSQPEPVSLELVSGGYYSTLGVRALTGRTFDAGVDGVPGANPVAVISHGFWQRRFGSDPSVIGRTFRRLDTTFTIIGVTPPEFTGVVFGTVADISVPVSMINEIAGSRSGNSWLNDTGTHWLAVVGRLRPGVAAAQAEAELKAAFANIMEAEAFQAGDDRRSKELRGQRMELRAAGNGIDDRRRDFREPLMLLMGAVILVLLLACANVANLLLTKSAARQREIAVRLAIGAGRGRVVRQLLAEGMLLSAGGGALGVLLAYWTASGLVAMMGNGGPAIALETAPDGRILCFALLVSAVSCLLFSLAPALQSTRVNVQSTLAEARAPRWNLGKALIVAQMAISVVLLIGAGLFGRSLFEMYAQDPGFRPQGLVLFSTNLSRLGYEPERLEPLWPQILEEVRAIPGVEVATMSAFPPVSGGSGWDARVRVEGYTHAADEPNVSHGNRIGPDFFRTYGTPVIAGRDLEQRDYAKPVALVNESFARYYFKDRSPLGKWIGPDYPGQTARFEVIGVVRDVKYEGLRQVAPRTIYLPLAQTRAGNATFAIRTNRSVSELAPVIRAALTRVDAAAQPQALRTMDQHVARSLLTERMLATLAGSFGGLALMLGAMGIYGVMAYQVARRRREIGIRMALGANGRTVMGMVLRQTAALTLVGCVLGAVAGLALTRLAQGLLFGVRSNDPFSFGAAIGVLLLIALAAAYLPGRSAARTNPTITLRAD